MEGNGYTVEDYNNEAFDIVCKADKEWAIANRFGKYDIRRSQHMSKAGYYYREAKEVLRRKRRRFGDVDSISTVRSIKTYRRSSY